MKLRSIYYKNSYNILKEYIQKEYDIQVKEYANVSSMMIAYAKLNQSIIIINSNLADEKKLYTLSHEFGHFLAWADNDLNKGLNYNLKFEVDRESVCKISDRINILTSEYNAWYFGFEILKNLKISFNKKNFRKDMSNALNSYIRKLWRA